MTLCWFLNGVQVVGGSNPLAPTSNIKDLQRYVASPFSLLWRLGAFLGANIVTFHMHPQNI